ncbi:MAG: hypothetical protein H0U85_04185 [Gemmatimonadales bacterium]|nr:hypothetical protein [Gemmatimonadales bacterium]
MAETQARIGFGTLLKRGNGATPEVFTTIAEVKSITPPQADADDVDVTHMESPGRSREFIQGLTNPGEASFEVNWIPDDPTQDHLTGLLADQQAGTVRNWQIVLPAGLLTWGFRGYVKKFNPDIPTDKELKASVTIKVSGASTFA